MSANDVGVSVSSVPLCEMASPPNQQDYARKEQTKNQNVSDFIVDIETGKQVVDENGPTNIEGE